MTKIEESEVKNLEENEENVETEETSATKPFDEVLENIPENERRVVKSMMSMSMQQLISPEMELMKKMTPEHVTNFLDTQKQAMQYQFKESKENKIFMVIALLIFMVFIIVLIILLIDKPDILEKILYTLGGLIAGVFGGYGYGKTKGEE